MPEDLPKEALNFSHSLQKTLNAQPGWELSRNQAIDLAVKNSVEFVGKGTECAVISSGGEYKKVIAFNYFDLDPQQAKRIFYSQRILSTLFPHNFPHFYASFSNNNEKGIYAGTIRQRINLDNQSRLKYPFEHVEKTLEELDVDIPFDVNVANFGLGPDGGQYYLDTSYIPPKAFSKDKIINYMQNNLRQDGEKYDNYDIRLVSKSIDRLAQL